MSTLKKERVIYITGIALGVAFLFALCLPYIRVGLYTNQQSVTEAESVVYLGWQFFSWVGYYITGKGATAISPDGTPIPSMQKTYRNITPIGTESMFIMFNTALFIIVLILMVWDGYALYKNVKEGKSVGKKFINILHIAYALISCMLLIAIFPYVNYLNTHEFTASSMSVNSAEAKAWSSFAFKNLSGVETVINIGPYVITALGLIAAVISLIFTMKVQDNSILYPYKKRQVYASIATLALCVIVFFLPNIDYYFSTYAIYEQGEQGLKNFLFTTNNAQGTTNLNAGGLEKIAQSFTTGLGWDCLSFGSGDIAGFYKVMFIMMFVVSGMGIIYSVLNLLGAVGLIRFNFNRKYLNIITAILMGCGILLWGASFFYSISVNTRLESLYASDAFEKWFNIAYPDGYFPQTICTLGAWLSMLPGIAGFAATTAFNAYDD